MTSAKNFTTAANDDVDDKGENEEQTKNRSDEKNVRSDGDKDKGEEEKENKDKERDDRKEDDKEEKEKMEEKKGAKRRRRG